MSEDPLKALGFGCGGKITQPLEISIEPLSLDRASPTGFGSNHDVTWPDTPLDLAVRSVVFWNEQEEIIFRDTLFTRQRQVRGRDQGSETLKRTGGGSIVAGIGLE